MTPEQLADGEAAVEKIVAFISDFYPPLKMFAPLIDAFLREQVAIIKAGVADGSIVSDGQGFVPAHGQSTYDPKTGVFTGKKT